MSVSAQSVCRHSAQRLTLCLKTNRWTLGLWREEHCFKYCSTATLDLGLKAFFSLEVDICTCFEICKLIDIRSFIGVQGRVSNPDIGSFEQEVPRNRAQKKLHTADRFCQLSCAVLDYGYGLVMSPK